MIRSRFFVLVLLLAGLIGWKAGTLESLGVYQMEVRSAGGASHWGLRVQTDNPGGYVGSFGGVGDFVVDAPSVIGGRLVIKEGGNVGIGTPSPGQRLSVAGAVESTSGGFKFPDGSVQSTAGGGIGATYTISRNLDITLPTISGNHGPVTLLHLDFPAATYALSATVSIQNFGDAGNALSCGFSSSPSVSEQYSFGGPFNSIWGHTLNFHSVLNLPSYGVDLWCWGGGGGGPIDAEGISRLTAMTISGPLFVQ